MCPPIGIKIFIIALDYIRVLLFSIKFEDVQLATLSKTFMLEVAFELESLAKFE